MESTHDLVGFHGGDEMTYARRNGELLEVINVDWSKRLFDYLKSKHTDVKVSVRDRKGNVYLVYFRELEWEEQT